MSNPFIEVDLSKIRDNTHTVVQQLKAQGISVTGVTKAVCGHPAIAQAMLDGGAAGLAEARLSNVQKLRKAGIISSITLLRTPMLSQADQVVQLCETSYNTEMTVIAALAAAAIRHDKVHGIILMVEMGDTREGIMPLDLRDIAQQVVDMPGVALKGIGANFACLSGIVPAATQMTALSDLASETEGTCGSFLQTVSGGNSANLPWAFGDLATGRINNLRVGEAILLGVDPVSGDQISGMHNDAFALVTEVIETDAKAAELPIGLVASASSGRDILPTNGETTRLILAIGRQDTDVHGLTMPLGNAFIGATSDHLIISTTQSTLSVGTEIRFQMNYSALMQAMSAPDIDAIPLGEPPFRNRRSTRDPNKHLAMI